MSDAKRKAIEAISSLPDDTEPQEIINLLYRIYRIQRGLTARGGTASGATLRDHLERQVALPPSRSKEDIDRQVEQERDGWE